MNKVNAPSGAAIFRTGALALMFVLGISCASAAHFSGVAGRFDCPDIGNSQNCAISIEASLHAPFLHRTSNRRLDVDLVSGLVYSFVDVDVEGGAAVYYNALEASPNSQYVVIHRQFHEGNGYGLLDRRSGTFTTFVGYPLLSPDGRWLAVTNGNENDELVFQIFEVVGGVFRLAFDAKAGKWWPANVAWQSSTVLFYERSSFDPDNRLVTANAKLQFDDKRWK